MQNDQALRIQLLNLLALRQAHMSFEDAIVDFPMEHINTRPPNVTYTFWHLLEHIRFCQHDILDYIKNPNYQYPNFPVDLWPAENATTTPKGWQSTINQFVKDRQAFADIIQNPETDLYSPMPHVQANHSIIREILIVVDHNAYHLGEFAILRQVMNLW